MSEINAPENGIVSNRGDCPQSSVVAQSMQANSGGESQKNVESGRAAGINLKVFNQTRTNYADKISKGDHVGIVLDEAKVDRPDSCPCCKREVGKLEKLWDRKKSTRVIIWEEPKLKFKGHSITAHDYTEHSYPERERIPPWHPYRRDPWKPVDVPSVTETTYSRDFAPPTYKRLLMRDRNQQHAQDSN